MMLPYGFAYKTGSFPSKIITKNLDPSYKTDLDFWDCFRREDPISKQNIEDCFIYFGPF